MYDLDMPLRSKNNKKFGKQRSQFKQNLCFLAQKKEEDEGSEQDGQHAFETQIETQALLLTGKDKDVEEKTFKTVILIKNRCRALEKRGFNGWQ